MDDLKISAKEKAGLDALIQTVRVFSLVIGMEFGIEKCAVVIMKRGKMSSSNGIELPHDDVIKELIAEEGYKYLGVLESDTIMKNKMKEKISMEYFRRVKKVLETKLNSKNLIKGVNTWAISLMRYPAPFLDWTVDELKAMNRRTRKHLTMHKAFHPNDNIDMLYVGRKDIADDMSWAWLRGRAVGMGGRGGRHTPLEKIFVGKFCSLSANPAIF